MKRSTLIVAGLFLALLAGAVIVIMQKPERGIARMAFAEVDKDKVDRVAVSGKNAVELEKKDGAWRLANGKPADGAAVTRMVEGIAKMKSSDLLTTDSSRYVEYEVDDEKGAKIVASAGGRSVAELVVGKSVPGGLAVRVQGSVFKVGGTSPGLYVRAANAWIEHKMLSDKPDDVSRVEVRLAGQGPYALVKKDGGWTAEDPKMLPAGFRFDADAARSLVMGVANLRAKDFVDTDPGVEKTGLGDKADVFVVEVTPAAPAAKVTRTLRLGLANDQKDVYGKIDGREELFTVYESTAKSMRKALMELRDLELMAFDKDKAQKLALSDGKVSLAFEKKDGAWQLVKTSESKPAGFELDPGAVERRLAAFVGARAVRLAEAKEKAGAGVDGASAKITVTLEGGATATLSFGKEIKESDNRELVFAKGNADGETYLAAKWTRQNLTGGLASFKKQPAAQNPWGNLDPQALSSLPPDVRDNLMKQMMQKQREQDLLKQLEGQAPKAAPGPAPHK